MENYPDIFANKEEFKDWMEGQGYPRSTRELTVRQFDQVMKQMNQLFRSGRGFITHAQKQKLRALRELIGMDKPRFWGFVKHQFGIKKAERMLLSHEATSLITGLQKWIAGGDQHLYNELNNATSDRGFSLKLRNRIRELQMTR